jgi:hypothetical protein
MATVIAMIVPLPAHRQALADPRVRPTASLSGRRLQFQQGHSQQPTESIRTLTEQ